MISGWYLHTEKTVKTREKLPMNNYYILILRAFKKFFSKNNLKSMLSLNLFIVALNIPVQYYYF